MAGIRDDRDLPDVKVGEDVENGLRPILRTAPG
jgi:hypothetical protein